MTALSVPARLPEISAENGLSRYLSAIRAFPMLSAEEETRYARRVREDGDRQAAYHLVTSHLRLAAKIALNYRGYGLPVADLISEANVGLMLAVKRFEPEKGFRLSTYARWWIKAAVQEYVLRSWSLVKLGTTAAQKKLFFNLRKLKGRISAHDNDDLSPEQVDYIAEQLNVGARDVLEMNGRLRGDVSLATPLSQHASSPARQDDLPDPTPDPETLLCAAEERTQKRTALRLALEDLTPRERSIIHARFLMEKPRTLEELGQAFGVSRERIRQLEIRALRKIKASISAAHEVATPSRRASGAISSFDRTMRQARLRDSRSCSDHLTAQAGNGGRCDTVEMRRSYDV